MTRVASALAHWAAGFAPAAEDEAMAQRALVDTVAVALAARDDPVGRMLSPLGRAGRWAAFAHVLDFDDLHLPSTTHVSAVCVPVALAAGGGAHASWSVRG